MATNDLRAEHDEVEEEGSDRSIIRKFINNPLTFKDYYRHDEIGDDLKM